MSIEQCPVCGGTQFENRTHEFRGVRRTVYMMLMTCTDCGESAMGRKEAERLQQYLSKPGIADDIE